MTEYNPLAPMLALMAPPLEVAPTDWAAVEQQWGTRFPPDYVRFLDTYGQGAIGDYLLIARPLGAPRLEDCQDAGGGDEPYPAPAGLLEWGGTPDGDSCYFKTAPRPEDWQVVIWRRYHAWNEPRSKRHPYGLQEFLLKTINGELPDNPFSGIGVWATRDPRYVPDES